MSCVGHTSTTGWHCGACHLTFGGLSGFDGHRMGPVERRRCMDPSELTAKGWSHDGRVWRAPVSEADAVRLARLRKPNRLVEAILENANEIGEAVRGGLIEAVREGLIPPRART